MFIDIVDTRDMDEHTGGRKRKVQDDRYDSCFKSLKSVISRPFFSILFCILLKPYVITLSMLNFCYFVDYFLFFNDMDKKTR